MAQRYKMWPSNLPLQCSVTAPKRVSAAESPPPLPATAEPPPNRKPYGRPAEARPHVATARRLQGLERGAGEGGEAGRQPQRSSATATAQRPLGQAAAASILTAQSEAQEERKGNQRGTSDSNLCLFSLRSGAGTLRGAWEWGGAGARAGKAEMGPRAAGSECKGGASVVIENVSSCPALALAALEFKRSDLC